MPNAFVGYLDSLGEVLGESVKGRPTESPTLCKLAIVPRNLVFLAVVLLHGFRRLLPPYS